MTLVEGASTMDEWLLPRKSTETSSSSAELEYVLQLAVGGFLQCGVDLVHR